MAQFSVNTSPQRFDPYKNFKFRVKFGDSPDFVAGISKVGGLKRTTEVVKHREGGDPSSSRKSPAALSMTPSLSNAASRMTRTLSNGQTRFGISDQASAARFRSKTFARTFALRSTTKPASWPSPTTSFVAGYRNSRRFPISMRMPMPWPSNTSSWRTKVGNATIR